MPTIHSQIAASHEAAGIADEEDRSTTVLLWCAESAEHVLLRPLGFAVGELAEEFLHHGSDDIAGRDGIHPNSVVAPLRSQVTSQLEDTGLAGVVCRTDETL